MQQKLRDAIGAGPATVIGRTHRALEKLRGGVSIATEDGRRVRTAPATIRLVKEANNPWYEVTLIEGRNREIRRMFEKVGHHVEKIKRVRYGPLTLDVPPGQFRALTLREVDRLRTACGKQTAGTKLSRHPSSQDEPPNQDEPRA